MYSFIPRENLLTYGHEGENSSSEIVLRRFSFDKVKIGKNPAEIASSEILESNEDWHITNLIAKCIVWRNWTYPERIKWLYFDATHCGKKKNQFYTKSSKSPYYNTKFKMSNMSRTFQCVFPLHKTVSWFIINQMLPSIWRLQMN